MVTAADIDRLLPAAAACRCRHAADGAQTFETFKQEAETELSLIQQLREHDWNVSETARALKMPRSNLYKKIERYGLSAGVDMSRAAEGLGRELAEIDRVIAKQRAAGPAPRRPRPPAGAAGAGRAGSVALTWFWVRLAVALGSRLLLWPYQRVCGLQLIFYLGAAAHCRADRRAAARWRAGRIGAASPTCSSLLSWSVGGGSWRCARCCRAWATPRPAWRAGARRARGAAARRPPEPARRLAALAAAGAERRQLTVRSTQPLILHCHGIYGQDVPQFHRR